MADTSEAYVGLETALQQNNVDYDVLQGGIILAEVPAGLIAPDAPSRAFRKFIDLENVGTEHVHLGYVAIPSELLTVDESSSGPADELSLDDIARSHDIHFDPADIMPKNIRGLRGMLHTSMGFDTVLAMQDQKDTKSGLVIATIQPMTIEGLFDDRAMNQKNASDARITEATKTVWMHRLWSLIGPFRSATDLYGSASAKGGRLGLAFGDFKEVAAWKKERFIRWQIHTERGNQLLELIQKTDPALVASLGFKLPDRDDEMLTAERLAHLVNYIPSSKQAHVLGVDFMLEREVDGEYVSALRAAQCVQYILSGGYDLTVENVAKMYDSAYSIDELMSFATAASRAAAIQRKPKAAALKARSTTPAPMDDDTLEPLPTQSTNLVAVPIRVKNRSAPETIADAEHVFKEVQDGVFVDEIDPRAARVILHMNERGSLAALKSTFPDESDYMIVQARRVLGIRNSHNGLDEPTHSADRYQ